MAGLPLLRFVIYFLPLLLNVEQELYAQQLPTAANQIDSKNRRQGNWVIWMDAAFKPSADQQQVHYYRQLTYRDDKPTGPFIDFYRSGAMQCKGVLLQDRPEDVYDGLITWYREEGSKEQEILYKQGEISGDIRLFSSDGTLITESFEVLNTKAQVASQQGDLRNAKRYYSDALLVVSADYGSDHIYYATILNNMAMVQQDLGEFEIAEENYLLVLEIYARESGKQDEFYANTLNNLGTLYETIGSFKKAEICLQEALTIRENVLGPKHPDYAITLNNLGNLYIDLGLYHQAIVYLEKAVSVKASASGKESSEYATSLSNLGLAYLAAGNYVKAEPLLINALEIKKNKLGVWNPEYAACLNNLGHLYSTYGNLDNAERHFLEAKDIYSRGLKTDAGYTNTLNNLALVYKEKGEFQKAETAYQECIKSKGTLFGTAHSSYINSINNLAELYHAHGDLDKAESLLLQVEKNWKQTFGNHHPLYSTALYNLGTLYTDMHDFARAELYLLQAKEIREKVVGKDHPDYVATLNALAVLYDNENLDKQAVPYYQESLRGKIREILNYFPSLSEEEKTKYFLANQIYFQNAVECYLSQLPAIPSLADDLYNLRLVTKALLFNAVSKMRTTILSGNDPVLIQMFNQWQDKREYLAKVYRMSLEEKSINEINQEQLEDEVNVLEKELSRRSELFLKTQDRKLYTWRDVQNRLAPGQAAIEIIQTQRRIKEVKKVYLVLLVKPGVNLPEVIVLENGDELENKFVRYYRNAITQRMTDASSYDQFWKPITGKLSGVKRVYVSADGVFNQINLSTLFNNAANRFLMDEMEIRNITSTKDLVATHEAISHIPDASLFGYPNYNSSLPAENIATGLSMNVPLLKKDSTQRFFDGENITELPGTKREIETIATILNQKKVNVKTYLLADASEEKLKSLQHPSVLHIATHGYFLQDIMKSTAGERGFAGFSNAVVFENPLLRSGLILSGARTAFLKTNQSATGSDGLLTAYEAMNLNLDKTDLVVLSACETGLGVTVNGEGVYGLQRAFSVAGARYTLMSLWKVDDTATQEFMTSFYTAWMNQLDVNQALRKAQQEVRSKYPEPYYWGAFVLSGL